MKLSTEVRTAMGLALAGMAIIGLAVLTSVNLRSSVATNREIRQAQAVLQEVDGTLAALEDAARAERGYIFTGDAAYLDPYRAARSEVQEHLKSLRSLAANNPHYKERLPALEPHVAASLLLLQEGIDLRQEKGLQVGRPAVAQTEARQLILSNKSKAEMEQVRNSAAALKQEEDDLLKQREDTFDLHTVRSLRYTVVMVGFVLALLGTIFFVVRQDIHARARTRKKLQDSEVRLRALLEGAPAGVLGVNTDGKILFANAHAEEIFGYAHGELLGAPVELLMPERFRGHHPGQRASYYAQPQTRAMGAGRILHGRRKNGSEFPAEIGLSFAETADGPLIITMVQDITERKMTEEEIRRATSFLDSIVENIPNLIFLKDARDLRYVRLNRAGEELLGHSREELLGRNDHDLFPGEADFFTSKDRELLQSGKPLDIPEESVHTKDHGVRILHTRKIPIFDAAGRPAYILGVSEDITERKRMQEELLRAKEDLEQRVRERTAELHQSNEELLQQILENRKTLEARRESEQRLALHMRQTPLAAIEWNLNYEVTEWNPAAEKVFGYTREEALGRHANFIVPEHFRAHTEKVLRDLVARTGGARSTNENVTKEGKIILCEWYNTPLVDKNGRVVGVASLANDVSEYRRLEEQFRQAQKMEAIGQLAGGVAHDFNNLLNVILGYSDMLLDGMPGNDPKRKSIEHIRSAGERAASLTRQLLAFSRKQVLEPRVVNLNDILLGMDHLLRRLIGEDIELVRHADPSLGLVKVDPGQMEQVVMNLAVNARDAMPHGGKLTLEASNLVLQPETSSNPMGSKPGEYVVLTISDTGSGMDQATQKHIFEPFFTTKEPGKGTGLGLSTVYGIVQQSGGSVWVSSEPGQGTTFKIYLPRVSGIAQSLAPAEPLRLDTRGAETILVVEDDDSLRMLACEYLSAKGYTVLSAASGPAALRLVECHPGPIALLITDVVMPGMSGPVLAEKLLQIRPHLKPLFVSGYTQNVIFQDGVIDAGVEFLQKPYKLFDLAQKVHNMLAQGPASRV